MDACKMFLDGVLTRLYISVIYEWWGQPAAASVLTYLSVYNYEYIHIRSLIWSLCVCVCVWI